VELDPTISFANGVLQYDATLRRSGCEHSLIDTLRLIMWKSIPAEKQQHLLAIISELTLGDAICVVSI
jgi:hypothetical protein